MNTILINILRYLGFKAHAVILALFDYLIISPITCVHDMFTNVGDVHTTITQDSRGADLTLPKPKTNNMKNAFSCRGAEVWNCLSASLKASTTIANFKFNLKHAN